MCIDVLMPICQSPEGCTAVCFHEAGISPRERPSPFSEDWTFGDSRTRRVLSLGGNPLVVGFKRVPFGHFGVICPLLTDRQGVVPSK